MKCPLCGNENDIRQSDKYLEPVENIEYTVFFCPQCKVEFTDPMRNPGPEWYKKSEFYRDSDNPVTKTLNPRMAPFFKYEFPKGLSLLDVGCGFGNFLFHAKRKGFICSGIDFSDKQAAVAKMNSGVDDIEAITLDSFRRKYPLRKFDVITLFGYLEHQENPFGIIETCKNMLNDNGFVAINVPNRKRPILFGNRETWDLPPHHLTRWDSESLAGFLKRSGFVQVLKKDTPVTATHIFNQLIGIELNHALLKLISAVKRVIFKTDAASSSEQSFDDLSDKTVAGNRLKGLLSIRAIRRLPVLFMKAAAYLILLPATLPAALYYRALTGRGCELFALAKRAK